MSQLNQKTFKVSGAYSNTIELEDANTTNLSILKMTERRVESGYNKF